MHPILRPLTSTDVGAWAALAAAVEEVDRTGEHYNEADLLEEMADPNLEVGKDLVGAFDGSDLVGYFKILVRGEAEGFLKIHVEGSVHPAERGRGVGTALVQAMLARASQARTEQRPGLPAKLMAAGPSANTSQQALLGDAGFAAERWNFVMRVQLDGLRDPLPMPPGYRVRRYEASMATHMLAAHNTAFLDHPEFTPWTEVMWRQWVTESRSFRPDVSFVAVAAEHPDEIVAYVQSNEYDAYFQATGRREAFIAKLGTLRGHRGKGVAGAMLQHCLAAYRDAGYDEAALDVDSENPTGALGVYTRAGFEVETRSTNYTKVID